MCAGETRETRGNHGERWHCFAGQTAGHDALSLASGGCAAANGARPSSSDPCSLPPRPSIQSRTLPDRCHADGPGRRPESGEASSTASFAGGPPHPTAPARRRLARHACERRRLARGGLLRTTTSTELAEEPGAPSASEEKRGCRAGGVAPGARNQGDRRERIHAGPTRRGRREGPEARRAGHGDRGWPAEEGARVQRRRAIEAERVAE